MQFKVYEFYLLSGFNNAPQFKYNPNVKKLRASYTKCNYVYRTQKFLHENNTNVLDTESAKFLEQ